MARRKSQADSENEDKEPKQSSNSINKSYIQAKIMSKTKLLHKRLNINTNLLSKVKSEIESESGTEDSSTPKPKLKSKVRKRQKEEVSASDSKSGSEDSTLKPKLNSNVKKGQKEEVSASDFESGTNDSTPKPKLKSKVKKRQKEEVSASDFESGTEYSTPKPKLKSKIKKRRKEEVSASDSESGTKDSTPKPKLNSNVQKRQKEYVSASDFESGTEDSLPKPKLKSKVKKRRKDVSASDSESGTKDSTLKPKLKSKIKKRRKKEVSASNSESGTNDSTPKPKLKSKVKKRQKEEVSASDFESGTEDSTPKPKLKSKVKKRQKEVSAGDSESERQSTIESLLNETRKKVLTISKSKKSHNRLSSTKASKAFPPEIKKEPLDETYCSENEVIDTTENDSASEPAETSKSTNELQKGGVSQDNERKNDESDIIPEEKADKIKMDSIENKIGILQNIQISPPKTKTPQQQLQEMHPNLKIIDIHTKLKLKDSDDVYLFRTPNSVDPTSLLNLDINVEGCKIKVGGEKFKITRTSRIPDPTLVLSNKTKVLHFKGNIVMEKYVKVKTGPNIPVLKKSLVPLPKKLKNRHPLFGSEYEEKLQLGEAVEKKLDDAIRNLLKSPKKKSKQIESKRMSLINSTLLSDVNSTEFNSNQSPISHLKKSKKKKRTDTTDDELVNNHLQFETELFGTEYVESKPKKHKVKKETSDSGKAFELSTEKDERKTKKRKNKEEPEEVNTPKKKKKKKVKRDVQ